MTSQTAGIMETSDMTHNDTDNPLEQMCDHSLTDHSIMECELQTRRWGRTQDIEALIPTLDRRQIYKMIGAFMWLPSDSRPDITEADMAIFERLMQASTNGEYAGAVSCCQ